jgi:hypothetical protein
MTSVEGDFQELSNLLFSAKERYRFVVRTISWGYPPIIFHDFNASEGTTDHLLLVDAELDFSHLRAIGIDMPFTSMPQK